MLVVDAARIHDAGPRGPGAAAGDACRSSRRSTRSTRVGDKRALLPRLARIAALRDFAAIVPISAERGTELAGAEARDRRAPARRSPPLYPADDITDRDERFLAAEFVREKIFRLLGDEVPYATTVVIERFEQEGELRRIDATVLVDKRASARS